MMSGVCLLLAICAMGGETVAEPLRVLIVTGQDIVAHDWRTTGPALRAILERGKQCEARVVEDPDILATDLIFDYQVVVLHFYNERPLPREAEARANLSRFVRDEGRGLVLVHFASGAFGDWEGFGELAGMVWDKVNTHDPRGPFEVRLLGEGHPIVAGLETFEADDELYTGLEQRREVEVLAVARSKVTGQDHPMAFAFHSGRGRVFHTPLGHDVKALQQPGVSELLVRGCLWAGGRIR